MLLGSLGDLFVAEGKLDSALICYERQEFIFNKLSDHVSLANNLYNKAEVYVRLGDEKVTRRLVEPGFGDECQAQRPFGGCTMPAKKGIHQL